MPRCHGRRYLLLHAVLDAGPSIASLMHHGISDLRHKTLSNLRQLMCVLLLPTRIKVGEMRHQSDNKVHGRCRP